MSELQDIIATSSIRAFNHGMQAERQHVIQLLEQHKLQTECDYLGCESWTQAFEFLIQEVKGKIHD